MGEQLNHWIRRYADFVIHRRLWVICLTLIAVVAAGYGGSRLVFSNNYRVFFSDSNPELNNFEAFQKIYTKSDNFVFILKPDSGDVAGRQTAAALEWLTNEAWQIPYTTRVDSISNFQHTWADGDNLIVEDLLADSAGMTPQQLHDRTDIALHEPLLRGNLIANHGSAVGINVTVQYPEINDLQELPEAVQYARGLARQFNERYPDIQLALSGLSMLNNAFAEAGQQDAQTLVPLMYLVLIVVLMLVLRSVSGAITTLMVIFFSSITAMGLAGYLGIKLTPISITAPTIIMTLSIADSIHILATMTGLMRDGADKLQALKESIRINFIPVTITSLTTVIGFLSLNFTDTPPFWHLGNITAMGITAAWIYSLLFLPALLSWLPVRPVRRSGVMDWTQLQLGRLAEFVIRKQRPILLVSAAISVALVAAISKIELNDEFVRYFDQRVAFRNDTDFMTKNLTGIYLVEYSLPATGPGGVSEPEYLDNLERFTDWLRTQPEVAHVYSYSDIIKRLNKNMHGDRPDWYRIPLDRETAAQYLLLYELSLPYGLDLNDRINIDKSATRVSITLDDVSTSVIREFLDRSGQWLDQNTPDYMQAMPTSASVMFSHISQRNIESMFKGNVMAVLLIAIVLMLTLRSFGLGALSLIPNVLPIMTTFGIWAFLVGQVGMAAATITATSLGIVVDDTVHFLAKYALARREKGLAAADAIRYAFRTVGPAIVMTTVVLTIGFSVLIFSTFLINAQMGLLTAIAIVAALFCDFLLLPALLLIRKQPQENQDDAYEPLSEAA